MQNTYLTFVFEDTRDPTFRSVVLFLEVQLLDLETLHPGKAVDTVYYSPHTSCT